MKDSIRERIDKTESEQYYRLKALLINRNKLTNQVSRIKQTIAKILDGNTSLAEKLRTLFMEQEIVLAAIFTAISMIISTIVVSLTGGSGGAGGTPKGKNKLVE